MRNLVVENNIPCSQTSRPEVLADSAKSLCVTQNRIQFANQAELESAFHPI